MRFEVSERLVTRAPGTRVLTELQQQFEKSAKTSAQGASDFVVTGIENTFGSINYTDKTLVTVGPMEDGYLITADVAYNPSIWFWFFVVIGIFTGVLWLLPVVFFFYHRNSMQKSIESTFSRVKNSLADPVTKQEKATGNISDLAELADLKAKGIITEDEFNKKKSQILGI